MWAIVKGTKSTTSSAESAGREGMSTFFSPNTRENNMGWRVPTTEETVIEFWDIFSMTNFENSTDGKSTGEPLAD
jgi:hypothetical protein